MSDSTEAVGAVTTVAVLGFLAIVLLVAIAAMTVDCRHSRQECYEHGGHEMGTSGCVVPDKAKP